MKKEHSKYQWIIGISENDGVKLYKYTGTVKIRHMIGLFTLQKNYQKIKLQKRLGSYRKIVSKIYWIFA